MEAIALLGGVAVSVIVQIVKNKLGTSTGVTLITVLALSLAAAGLYEVLQWSGYWEGFVQTLAVAGSVYTFIIRRFEE